MPAAVMGADCLVVTPGRLGLAVNVGLALVVPLPDPHPARNVTTAAAADRARRTFNDILNLAARWPADAADKAWPEIGVLHQSAGPGAR